MSHNTIRNKVQTYIEDNPWLRKTVLAAIFFVALWFIGGSLFTDDAMTEKQVESQSVTSILGLSDSLGSMDQREAEGIVDEMKVRLADKERDMEAKYSKDAENLEQLKLSMQQMKNELFELKRKDATNTKPIDISTQLGKKQYQVQGEPVTYQADQQNPNLLYRPQTEIITQSPQIKGNVIRTITQRSIREVQRSGEVTISDIKVQRLTNDTQNVDDSREGQLVKDNSDRNPSAKGDKGEFTLAMGSILSGTLINGVAAPTKVGSQDTPIPILLRVKREAIMPNFFSLDIRECMILGAGIGNLASERVEVRAEAISCITNDGQAIERPLTAYAVSSSDGLTGIRGTVIERSGKAIGNSIKAGFLSGFASAAKPQQVPSLNTELSASTVWQSQNLDQFAGAGIMEGASSAMERVASYYLAIAEAMWPVIEIPAGIEVDFLVQKGMTLQLNKDDIKDLK